MIFLQATDENNNPLDPVSLDDVISQFIANSPVFNVIAQSAGISEDGEVPENLPNSIIMLRILFDVLSGDNPTTIAGKYKESEIVNVANALGVRSFESDREIETVDRVINNLRLGLKELVEAI